MNLIFSMHDFFSISSLFILLLGGILILFFEIFFTEPSKKVFIGITISTLLLGMFSIYFAPISQNTLLTSWLRFDFLSRFFSFLFLFTSLAVTFISVPFLNHALKSGEYFFFLLSSTFGLLLIAHAADFLTLFLGLETLSITLYIWCSYMKKWGDSQEASIKYFLLGSLGAAILLYGIALIYGASGTTQFNKLLESFQSPETNRYLFTGGITLITVGLAFKAAIFPFHSWAPDVYEGAPTPVTAFMSVGTKAGAFAAFVIIFLVFLPSTLLFWSRSVIALAIFTLIYANFVALRQSELRRFFAYSGISHAGFLLIPLATNNSQSIEAILFYLIIYSLATLGAFSIIATIDQHPKGMNIEDLKSYAFRSPIRAFIMTVCLLTLAGFPPTAGFLAKLYFFKLAYESHFFILLLVALFTSILSAYYYLRIIMIMFTRQSEYFNPILKSYSLFFVGIFTCIAIMLITFFPSLLSIT